MDTKFKECLRWAAVVLFGGVGLRILFYDFLGTVLRRHDIGTSMLLICLLLGVSLSAPFLGAAWFCFRRQYHCLITVFAAMAALGVFGALMWLSKVLLSALNEGLFSRPGGTSWPGLVLGLPVSLLCLFVPFYAAERFFLWFESRCHRVAARWFGSRWCPEDRAKV